MSDALFKLLDSEVRLRDWTEDRQAMDEMADIYEGRLPREYEKFFPKNTPKHLVQMIPLAHDDLATMAGRLPDLRGEPRNMTNKELKAIGLQEKIAFNYLRNSKPNGKLFMKQLAWWLQLGRAVAIVEPDLDAKMPRFSLRDPRTCFPGVKESVNNTIIELSDLIFKYELDYREAVKRGLAVPKSETQGRWGEQEPHSKIEVIEYVDTKDWMIVSSQGLAKTASHNLGIVPGQLFQTFTPNSRAGKARFRDQVSLMIAISRLITAKIAMADQFLNPIMWAKGHEGTIEIGPGILNKLGPQGEIGRLDPPHQLQVDQDIAMLDRYNRILNRNPEVRQGEITAKSVYTSAKTLEQLSESIDTVVGGDWDVIGPGMEYLFRVAFEMETKLWPNVEKTISGKFKGKKFLDTYTPKADIGDRTSIRVDYGFGVGGYQGFLMHLQGKDAGVMATRRVMEAMPGVSDVDEEMRLIELEAMDEAGKAMFQNQAVNGQLDMLLWADLRQEMAEKGLPLHEAIQKYQEAIVAQAQASQATEQGALTAPPVEGPPEEELPGIPPQVLSGL